MERCILTSFLSFLSFLAFLSFLSFLFFFFFPRYVAELWNGTWLVPDGNASSTASYSDHPEYVPPNPHYLQMVVDYVEAILALKGPANAAPLSVVFDMHNYQRWCPMGIGGTWSCLEEAANATGKIKYSADAATTSCRECVVAFAAVPVFV